MRHARVSGVPPRRAVRRRRAADLGEHPAAVPRAQFLRGAALFRPRGSRRRNDLPRGRL